VVPDNLYRIRDQVFRRESLFDVVSGDPCG
jgi:hypothetical protein